MVGIATYIVHTNKLQILPGLQPFNNLFIFFWPLLQKYRLHTRRASSDGGDQHAGGLWSSAPDQQYTTSQHSTSQSQSQSGSPQGPLQLAVSSRAMSATAGDSCDAGDEAQGGRSESYGWEMPQHGTKASSS